MTTSTSSFPAEINPSDGVTSVTVQIGPVVSTTPTAFVPPPSSKPKTAAPAGFATLFLSKLKTVVLGHKASALTVTAKASAATTLELRLLDHTGKKVAAWKKRTHTGSNTFRLLLPPKAKHPGHVVLQITETGNPTPKKLPVTLKA